MSDPDLSRPISDFTEREMADLIARTRERYDAELAAAAAPPATTPPTYGGADELSRRRAEAVAVAQAQEAAAAEQAQLVAGAKAVLAPKFEARGVSASELDELDADELLSLAGLNDPTPEQARQREQEAILADPALYAAHERQQDVQLLEARWWFLPKAERESECQRLGLDYAALDAHATAQMNKRTAL